MRTIWKATLLPFGTQEIEVPQGAEMLCAREQGDEMCVWYRCDPVAPKEQRRIAICGTGHPAPDGRYLGTCALDGGTLQFHVFEVSP
jgi:hypothetical protein